MREFSGDELLRLPVRLHGIDVGRPRDLLLDPEATRAVGLEILCRDDVHRFLPLPAAAVRDDEIRILSPLVLQDELDFYRSRALALSALRERPVVRKRHAVGTLRDVVVAADGELLGLVVEVDGGLGRIPLEASLEFVAASRPAA
jgi:hypothetical protein